METHTCVVVVGIFTWSNYSMDVLTSLVEREDEFRERDTGLAAFCLGSPEHVEAICPDLLPHFLTAITEPIVGEFVDRQLVYVSCGPQSADAILERIRNRE